MYKKKRAQVTVYIIIGIVILFLAILLFYLIGTTEKIEGMQELVRAQKIPKEVRPITTYVTTNLDDAAKKGLLLIGMQGGRIYESQGGTSDDSKIILYNENKVSYGLYKQEVDYISFYRHNPPNYPWHKFPYILDINSGYFGIYNLPTLDGPGPSIQLQLESFITSYLQENIDLMIFNEWGFDIDVDINKLDVSIVIGENDVTAFLTYPLVITKKSTNEVTNINYFYTNSQIRLKKVYNLAHDIIKEDIARILFNISDPNNNRDDMTIEKDEDAYEHDDVIIINDDKSMLYAEPYTFQFARENRNPALHLIYLEPLFKDCIFDDITEEDIHPDTHPKAYDPDEDVIAFTYDPPLPHPTTDLGPNNRFYVTVTVDDGILKDWQDLEILVICPVLT